MLFSLECNHILNKCKSIFGACHISKNYFYTCLLGSYRRDIFGKMKAHVMNEEYKNICILFCKGKEEGSPGIINLKSRLPRLEARIL